MFLEAHNTITSIVDYLACLRARHVVHLLEDLEETKARALVAHYRPHMLVTGSGVIVAQDAPALDLHPELALLLSTSGSTGSPKFVKLSARSLDANAAAIAGYLGLGPDERGLQHLKPHYSYGLSIINSHLSCGAALVLTQRTVLDDGFWDDLRSFEATSFAGVPYTFEALAHRDFRPADYGCLRYATQAGGRLEPGLVRSFAAAFAAANARFFVMYGQTEAAPRISYLPPELAEAKPDSIGQAIPGGTLYLIDEAGHRIDQAGLPGQLAYEGPNVMMGYATGPAELATDDTPKRLLTGDIARRDEDGLFRIVGRSSRFVKPFGVRVNLDEVQSYVRSNYGTAAVAGDDARIVVAVETATRVDCNALAARFALPVRVFAVRDYAAVPLLANRKYDYQAILADAQGGDTRRRSLLGRGIATILDVLGLNRTSWSSVHEVFQSLLADPAISDEQSFDDIAADSLSFVALAVELEDLFGGELPEEWQSLSIAELDRRLGSLALV